MLEGPFSGRTEGVTDSIGNFMPSAAIRAGRGVTYGLATLAHVHASVVIRQREGTARRGNGELRGGFEGEEVDAGLAVANDVCANVRLEESERGKFRHGSRSHALHRERDDAHVGRALVQIQIEA